MPRRARIDAPGALHHIVIRGIERSPIFNDHQDYEQFLQRCGKLLSETGTTCFAWALLGNHAHLLLRTGPMPLSTVMRRLLTGYAQYFNRRYARHGYVFQNRYKSFLCETDPYLWELVRYIHLNPLRARMVKDLGALDRSPLSGHSVIMGRIRRDWQDIDSVLALFHRKAGPARTAYRAFVKNGISLGKRPELVGGGLIRSLGGWSAVDALKSTALRIASDERILGSSDFVTTVLKQANEVRAVKAHMMANTIDLERLCGLIAARFGLDPSLIRSTHKRRDVSRARALFCHLALRRLGARGKDVAAGLHVTPSAVCKLAQKGGADALAQDIGAEVLNEEGLRYC